MKREHLTFVLLAAIGIPLLSLGVQEASAHGNFEVVFGGNANQTLRVVIGETAEPAYVDGVHNLEMRITDVLTGLPNTVAVKNNAGANILKVDKFFYPKNLMTLGEGAPPIIDKDGGGPGVCNTYSAGGIQYDATGGIGGCGPAPGFIDSKNNTDVASVFGQVGIYSAGNQYYTQYGRTLYHFYGHLNYFQDSTSALAPIDVWYDGKTVKVGYVNNVNATINGGFGLSDITTTYWPGANAGVNNSTHPDNIRSAIGQDRNNGIDIWNFLRDIADAINSIGNAAPYDPIASTTAK